MEVRDLLENNNIEYKSATKDYIIQCLNPEHDDGSPSCHVDKLSGIYNCWSCDFSGNIYTYFNKDVPHIIHHRSEQLRSKILKLMWSKPMQLPLTHTKWKNDFRGISAQTFEYFDAFTSEEFEDLKDRLIFPITNIRGDITSFTARYIHSDLFPKYKNYPPHVEIGMFPENIQEPGSMTLVEGIFDMLNLFDKGIPNVVMTSGINMGLVKKRVKREINKEKLLKYKLQGIDSINIMYDGDEAGRKAASGLASYIDDIFIVKIINLEDGQDPGSMTQEQVDKVKKELL